MTRGERLDLPMKPYGKFSNLRGLRQRLYRMLVSSSEYLVWRRL